MYAAILYISYITKYWIHLLPFIFIFHMRDGLVYSLLYRWAFRFCKGGAAARPSQGYVIQIQTSHLPSYQLPTLTSIVLFRRVLPVQ